MANEWSPSSWKTKPVAQDVIYPDEKELSNVLAKLATLPPLVTPSEVRDSTNPISLLITLFASFPHCILDSLVQIERLRHQLSLVQQNQAFLLHAGDCAESFDACTNENISAKIGLILSFSLILIWGARLPVVRIGRIAGQYAKPRSSATEKVKIKIGDTEIEKEVPSFRCCSSLVVNLGFNDSFFRGDNVNG